MFSKFTIYRFTGGLPEQADMLGQLFQRGEFTPTTPNQSSSAGWVPPRAKHGAFVEAIGGQWIARLMIETRKVPSDALQRRIDEVIARIEETTGRKLGRKERAEIKELCADELMPQAFPKQATVPVWIDPSAGLLVIGSTSQYQIDAVIGALCVVAPDVRLSMVNTKVAPQAAMAAWLSSFRYGELMSDSFETGRECELRAQDESKAVVRYKNENLERDEVLEHLKHGKMPTRLALIYDGRVAFVLTDSLQFKSVEVLDVVFDEKAGRESDGDSFDADAAIATGELGPLIARMIEELGGLVEPEPETEGPKTGANAAASVAYNPDGEGDDPMIDRARALVIASGKPSISYIQRTLAIGYNRAASLLEALEHEGIVSPMGRDGKRAITNHEKAAA